MKLIIDVDDKDYVMLKNTSITLDLNTIWHGKEKDKELTFAIFNLIKALVDGLPYEERPQGEWIPIKTRPLTDEERKSISQYYGFNYDASNEYAFDCPMPEEGQEILISTPWGVSKDRCEYDCTDDGMRLFSLEDRGDWEDVKAWMPLPEPYDSEVHDD